MWTAHRPAVRRMHDRPHPKNTGTIVGTYFDSSNGVHGWLLYEGKYYNFDDPKANNSTRADGLNDEFMSEESGIFLS